MDPLLEDFSADHTVRSALRKAGVSDIVAISDLSALRAAVDRTTEPLTEALDALSARLDALERDR